MTALDARLIDYADRLSDAELTWRTLADISDDPPGDLLLGMLEPDGPNLTPKAQAAILKGTTGPPGLSGWLSTTPASLVREYGAGPAETVLHTASPAKPVHFDAR